jgi:cysteine synthase A
VPSFAETISRLLMIFLPPGFAAVKTAIKLGPGHRVVTILCDSGTRHLSKFWAQAGDVGGATDTKLEDVLNTE